MNITESLGGFDMLRGLLAFRPERLLQSQETSREQFDVDTQNWRDMHYVRLRWPDYRFVARHDDGTILVERESDGVSFVCAIPERKTRRYVRMFQRAGWLPSAGVL